MDALKYRLETEQVLNELSKIRPSGALASDKRNHSLAQNVLREEIGFFGEYSGAHYYVSDESHDNLLAHAR